MILLLFSLLTPANAGPYDVPNLDTSMSPAPIYLANFLYVGWGDTPRVRFLGSASCGTDTPEIELTPPGKLINGVWYFTVPKGASAQFSEIRLFSDHTVQAVVWGTGGTQSTYTLVAGETARGMRAYDFGQNVTLPPLSCDMPSR